MYKAPLARGCAFVAYVVGVMLPGLAGAQDIPICTILYSHEQPCIASDGAGGGIVAWHDGRVGSENFDIYVQRIGASGALMWTIDGVVVTGAVGAQFFPRIASDGSGGVFIVWEDQRSGSDWDVYAQRVNTCGEALWTEDGIPVSAVEGDQRDLDVMEDGAGGVIIAWADTRSDTSGSDIYVQRVDAMGVGAWEANGAVVCEAAGDQGRPRLLSQGDGGAIIAWEDPRNNTYDIYAQRVRGDGTVAWDTNGVFISGPYGPQRSEELVSDLAGGAIIVWDDRRNGDGDIYAQRVDSTGQYLWTIYGEPILVAPEEQFRPKLVSDGASGAIVCWPDSRDDSSIYANRITADGVVAWGASGVPICLAPVTADWPKIAEDGHGGAVIIWEDTRNTTYPPPYQPDLYGQRVDADGTPLWTTNGVAVTTAPLDQRYADVIPYADGGVMVVWEDWRDGGYLAGHYRIYGQIVDGGGNLGPATAVNNDGASAPAFDVSRNVPNPFSDRTSFRVDLRAPASVTVTLYDVAGREVYRSTSSEMTAGTHELNLEARALSGARWRSGVYYCRIEAGGRVVTRKVTVIH